MDPNRFGIRNTDSFYLIFLSKKSKLPVRKKYYKTIGNLLKIPENKNLSLNKKIKKSRLSATNFGNL